MPWVKIDDQFPDHPKVVALGPDRLAGVGLFMVGLAYAARYLTDGLVPDGTLPPGSDKLAQRLVDVGLWEDGQGGYLIHDYLVYQPARADVLARRRYDAERKAQGRDVQSSSARNPSGFQPDSNRSPAGIPTESARNPMVPARTPTRSSSEPGVGTRNPYPVSGRNPSGQPDRAPGEAAVPVHDGRHGPTCLVCNPPKAGKVNGTPDPKPTPAPKPRPQVEKAVDNPEPEADLDVI